MFPLYNSTPILKSLVYDKHMVHADEQNRALMCLAKDPDLKGASYIDVAQDWQYVSHMVCKCALPCVDLLEAIWTQRSNMKSAWLKFSAKNADKFVGLAEGGVVELPMNALKATCVELYVQICNDQLPLRF